MLLDTGRKTREDAKIVRVTLLHNEDAGDGDMPDGEMLCKLMRAAGHEVLYQPCGDPDWAAALERPADVIAVAGGDGTVGRIAKKLIGRNTPLAPLPYGTANNISKTLGLTALTLEEIVRGWTRGRRITFDVGVARGPWGSRYFIEGAGVGLFARTIPIADENKTLKSLDDAEAKITYALMMLRERLARCSPHALKLKLDGRDVSGEYVLFEAMNMEFVGPNLYLAPNVRPADGLLDVVLVTPAERNTLRASLETWQEGELERPNLPARRASAIELEWNGFDVHIDDEAWPGDGEKPPRPSRIELTVERDALAFVGAAPG